MKVRKLYEDSNGWVEYWYDSSNRSWWAMRVDSEGNQVGEARFSATKREILAITVEFSVEKKAETREKLFSKSCLTCRFEPDWSPWVGSEGYRRSGGRCKWLKESEAGAAISSATLPASIRISEKYIERYSDNSGVHTECKAWEPK